MQKIAPENIFNIHTPHEFLQLTMEIFRFQAANNPVYSQYIKTLKINPTDISEIEKIPFLPIDFFKTHDVKIASETQNAKIFTSSGTTSTVQSKHFVNDVSIYEKSYLKSFELFYGALTDYCILALLPSYLEREGSSLIYMTDDFIKKTNHPQSGFYLNNTNDLLKTIESLHSQKQKTILLGVSYALLDLADKINAEKINPSIFQNCFIMETGGMKGKRKEMVKEELHETLKSAFDKKEIHSEYGMTELLSQAYSKANGIFITPPWMKIFIRDVNDPFTLLPENKSGGINIIDLANVNSCSFIATQDLGKAYSNNSFEVLGRFDNSDIRGCNLLVQ